MRTCRFVVGVLGVIGAGHTAAAQSDRYCTSLADHLQPNTLYRATCTDPSCLTPISPTGMIRAQTTARFLYRTAATPIQNSLVVVQLKYVGTTPRGSISGVRLTRHALDFACYRRNKAHVREAIPLDPDDPTRAPPEVPYKNYDDFHRYGFTSSDHHRTLSNFHTRYFNGEECVTTTDLNRRAQFLFEDRSNVAGVFRSAWRRIGGDDIVTTAVAAPEMLKYQQLHVVVSNYKKRPGLNGCFSFAVQGLGAAVEIAISDVEENVRSTDVQGRFSQRTWTIDVVPR